MTKSSNDKRPKLELLGPYSWRDRRHHPCQGLCESNSWWLRKYGEYPKCKHSGLFRYKGKEYCQIHMGLELIKERLNEQ